MKIAKKFLFFLLVMLIAVPAFALEADEIVEKASRAYYYAGADGRADVTMTITDSRGRTRTRGLTMLRYDVVDGGAQKYYVYFHRPADVEGMIFMVWKNVDRDDDRWLYIPAIDLVKRVAASDKRSSFAGSHFTYEDVSGRSTADDTHELLREEKLNGRNTYVVKNTPRDGATVEFSYYLTWIDRENFLPLKGEYYDKAGTLYKTMTSEEIKTIGDIPTVTKARATSAEGGETVVEFEEIKYNVGLNEDVFSERYLRKPPRKWVK